MKKETRHTHKNGFSYPRYVPLAFVLLGGFIGGCIIGLISSIMAISNFNNIDISYLFMVVIFGVFGIVFGFIPALLMGVYVAYRRFIIVDWHDYVHLYVVGTFISAIYFLCWSNVALNEPSDMAKLWVMGSIGGISAVLIGKLFIPKINPKDFNTSKERHETA